jgi:filamentous hemagglutinin family protein
MEGPMHLTSARRPLRRQQSSRHIGLAIALLLADAAVAPSAFAAGALPQGGNYVAGAGTIASGHNGLVITQPGSTRGVIDWNSFSIGKNNSVTFNNGSGATLNRVTGGSLSAILGSLTATGSLYLINPQGIVVGPSGMVSTGGRFVGSTLDVCNCEFMRGNGELTLSGDTNASVVNLGKISSSGGDVFLISRQFVVNAGSVKAPNGTAEMAVGASVLLQDSASSKQVFVQTGSQGTVVNKGKIDAAQVSLQAADGNIYALAGGGTRIRATGTATRNGHVWLLADDGRVKQSGIVTATNADGSGGTVDTQALQLAFGRHAAVHAGQWNVSTPTFTIGKSAARALQHSLNAGTSVDVVTTGANGATGDLGVASSLSWQGPASLTLAGYRNVSVAQGTTIANSGTGNLTLRADASGVDNGGSVVNSGAIDWSKSAGIVSALYDINGSYSPGTLVGNTAWTAPVYSGLVTQMTGYRLVNSVADLQNVASNLAGNYALGKDIDASNFAFKTLGYSTSSPSQSFTGQFDGMWHTVSGLTPSVNELFADIGATGVVRDVNVNSHSTHDTPYNSGILAGNNHGTIANVFTSGFMTSTSDAGDQYAGLVGTNYGLIARSGSSATVYADGAAAGLAVDNLGTITESYATGPIYAISSHGFAGGLVVSNTGTITQSFVSSSTLSAVEPRNVGAICAYCSGLGSDVYWDAEATGQSSSGGNLPASNGLTTAQMSDPASFVGWDFGPNGVWAMPVGATHPVLAWQVAPH